MDLLTVAGQLPGPGRLELGGITNVLGRQSLVEVSRACQFFRKETLGWRTWARETWDQVSDSNKDKRKAIFFGPDGIFR
jgi:hypothetical protein